MTNSKAGERIGRAGRQRKQIGKMWEEKWKSKRTRRGGHEELEARQMASHGVRVKVRYTEVRKGKNPEAKYR